MLVLDASGEIAPPETVPTSRRTIVVLNKSDVADESAVERLSALAGDAPVFLTSAVQDEGVDALCRGIRDSLIADAPEPSGGGIVVKERHAQSALEECAGHLDRALGEMRGQAREDLVAADLRLALDAVGRITGETTPDDILRSIFDDFCIGK